MKIENGFIEIGQIKLPVSILTLLAHQAHYLILTYFPRHRRFSIHLKEGGAETPLLIIENTSPEKAASYAKEFGATERFLEDTYSIIQVLTVQFHKRLTEQNKNPTPVMRKP